MACWMFFEMRHVERGAEWQSQLEIDGFFEYQHLAKSKQSTFPILRCYQILFAFDFFVMDKFCMQCYQRQQPHGQRSRPSCMRTRTNA